MARRPTGRNEIQDPSLPQKKRARWRVIGAAVLALAAAIVLPLALESEPKRPLADVDVRVPAREFGQPRFSVPAVAMNGDAAVRSDGIAGLGGDPAADTPIPAVAGAQGGRNALEALEAGRSADRRVTQVDLPATGRVPAPGRSAEPAAAPVVDVKPGNAAQAKAGAKAAENAGTASAGKADNATVASAAPKSAAKLDTVAQAKADPKPAARTDAAKSVAGQPESKGAAGRGGTAAAAAPEKIASAANTARAAKADPPAPPIPQRRVDRNDPKAASPAGFVIQIGAFSSAKSAQAQADRARKLGFDAYTEKFTTSKGEWTRVRVGPYLSREQADDARSRLKRRGIDTALIAP